ncbi:MAG: iron-containing alcohol dehydrogenase [Armatimonadetes bacterium]|nr:iron-containing alcohol dehydrogenase [Armatimonadota bacterium]
MNHLTLRGAKEIIFGSGTRLQTGQQAALLGGRALIVSGRTAMQRSGTLAELGACLAEAGVASSIFAEVEAEPSLDTVDRGREAFHSQQCDLVIAIGGGSALDVGKAIAALAPCPEPVSHYFAGVEIPGQGRPCIALPTTSGTGAEVTPNSVLTNTAAAEKASIRGHCLLPEVAIVDPELTLTCPPDQTAFSGLDALTQAIESYVSTGANPVSDMLCEESIRRIAGSLRRAVADGSDREARESMALGSLLAGLALASARLGLVHGLAHPLGALYGLPHGQVCGALLPHVMVYNMRAAGPKYARLARMLGLGADASALVGWVEALVHDLGAQLNFAAAGLSEVDIPAIVPPTLASGSSRHNPRPVDEAGVRELLATLIA